MGKCGFTLLELLISLSIIAILCLFTTPFSSNIIKKNQIDRVEQEIKSIIHFAKIQAILRNHTLKLVPLAKSKDWAQGMALFADDELVHQWSWPKTNIRVVWKGFQSKEFLLFTVQARNSAVNGIFLLQDDEKTKCLTINRLGRVREACPPSRA